MRLLARLIQKGFQTLKFHLKVTRLIPKVSTVAGFPCNSHVSYQRIWPSLQNHATRTFCTKAFTCRQYIYCQLIHTFALKGFRRRCYPSELCFLFMKSFHLFADFPPSLFTFNTKHFTSIIYIQYIFPLFLSY